MVNRKEKQKKIYRESAAAALVGEAVVVAERATVVLAIVVDGAAVVVDTVWIDWAVDKSDVFATSCELGLNRNLSLNLNGEGIFSNGLYEKSRYLEFFSQCRRG